MYKKPRNHRTFPTNLTWWTPDFLLSWALRPVKGRLDIPLEAPTVGGFPLNLQSRHNWCRNNLSNPQGWKTPLTSISFNVFHHHAVWFLFDTFFDGRSSRDPKRMHLKMMDFFANLRLKLKILKDFVKKLMTLIYNMISVATDRRV